MNPLGTHARIEEFARLLSGAVSGPGAATAGNAALAGRLWALAPALDAPPRAEFRATLRTRLVAVATVQAASGTLTPSAAPARPGAAALAAASTWSQGRTAQRRIGLLAGSMAAVIALTGIGIASSRSLPGAPFYGLKRGAEALQLDLVKGDVGKGSKHLEFAATRLREVQAMTFGERALSLGPVGQNGSATRLASGTAFGRSLQGKLTDTLGDFNRETRDGRNLLEKAYRSSGKPEPLHILKTFSAQQQSRLASLMPSLPAAAQASAEDALALVREVGVTATSLLALGTCTGECNPAAAGPTLPAVPAPPLLPGSPGATALPSSGADNNGVPNCQCAPTTAAPPPDAQGSPAPTPAPSPVPTSSPTGGAPTAEPSRGPTPEPKPTASPSASPAPLPLPVPLPTPLPTTLPIPIPTPTPIPLPLPSRLGNVLPALVPPTSR